MDPVEDVVEPRPPTRRTAWIAAICMIAVACAAGAVSATVGRMSGNEDSSTLQATSFARLRSRPESSDLSVHLMTVRAGAPRNVDVTVCVERDQAQWHVGELVSLLDVVLWEPSRQRLIARARLTRDRARAAELEGPTACVSMLQMGLPETRACSLDLAWPRDSAGPLLSTSRIAARVATWRGLELSDAATLALLALAIFVLLVAVAIAAPTAATDRNEATPLRALACLVVGVGVLYLPSAFALGPMAVLAAALSNAFAIALTALIVSPSARLESLALTRPRAWIWLAAPVAGLAIGIGSTALTRLIPGSGDSVVERAIAFPSGRITTAGLALLAPLAEEVIFRGALFAALRRYGVVAAVAVTSGLFALVHVPQLGGAHGALLGVAVAGLGFALLREATRSAWAPIVAHWTYNAALVALGIWNAVELNRPR